MNFGKSDKSVFDEPVPVCPKCGNPKGFDIVILGKLRRMPVMCKCDEERVKKYEMNEKRKEIERRLDRFRSYSLMDKNFEDSTFENWQFNEYNKVMYTLGKRYCENWEIMEKNNRGLIMWGEAGNGKTYLSFSIANELYKKGVSVLAVSVGRILNMIQETYRYDSSIGEMEILKTLNDVRLLILDDLGTESRTKWAYDKLYSIIDGRSRSKKPLIITTNLNNEELRKNLAVMDFKTNYIDHRERIYNRLIPMCTILEIKGSSWRIAQGAKNREALFKELGMGGKVSN